MATNLIDQTTLDHLGSNASEYGLRIYKQACWKLVNDLEMDESSALEEVWNNGDFMTRAGQILGINTDIRPITDIGSTYIEAEANRLGITEAAFEAEGGEGENHISVWALTSRDGFIFRVANTNAEPVWEEQDPAVFAELLESVGIDA